MQALELKIPPVAFTLLCVGLMWAVTAICPGATFPIAGSQIAAVVLAFIGGGIGIVGVAAFRRQSTTVNPLTPGSANSVVSDGIYRFTRNPMYLGLAVFLAGWAVFLENAAAFIVVPVFVAYMNRFQIRAEEQALLAKFGSGYSEYMSRVRRWL